MIEQSYLDLTLALQKSKEQFVKKLEYIKGTMALLKGYGLPVRLEARGIMVARLNGLVVPVVVVDSENVFKQIRVDPKQKVLNMTPKEWFPKKIVVLDGNWEPDSLIADLVLQGLLYSNCYQPGMVKIDHPSINPQILKKTNTFLSKRLDLSLRENWYRWISLGSNNSNVHFL